MWKRVYENSRKDIHREELDYIMLSLFSKKINVLIIGGGNAAFIKAKTFLNNGCNVYIVAKEIKEDFFSLEYKNLNLIEGEYDKSFLTKKHIVVIAIDDDRIISEITYDCEALDKLYINCKRPKEGVCILPMNIKTNETTIGINTLRGNPKASRMMGNYILNEAKHWDNFIKVTSIIRNNVKDIKEKKKEVLDFIISDDFKYFASKGKEELTLKLFYEENLVNKLFKD